MSVLLAAEAAEKSAVEVWMPAVVGVLTVSSALLASWLTTRTAAHQRAGERERAEADRRAAQEERRGAFQATTLLELQVAMQRLNRSIGYEFDVISRPSDPLEDQQWQRADPRQVEHDRAWSREHFEATAAVRLLAGRVIDDEVRAMVMAAIERATSMHLAGNLEDAQVAFFAAVQTSNQAIDMIGRAIRELPPPIEGSISLITSLMAPIDADTPRSM